MKNKSFALSFLIIFLACVFTVIGTCFIVFVYEENKIKITNVKLEVAQGINIYSDSELTKKIDSLILSDMEIGLKPVTGEIDSETLIPSTIDDKGTSEGYYSTIYVNSNSNFKITVCNVSIETKEDKIKVNEERENIFISIKDIENTTKSIENDVTKIVEFRNVSSPQKLTFLIWLGALADEVLEGAKIEFSLKFEII